MPQISKFEPGQSDVEMFSKKSRRGSHIPRMVTPIPMSKTTTTHTEADEEELEEIPGSSSWVEKQEMKSIISTVSSDSEDQFLGFAQRLKHKNVIGNNLFEMQ